MPNCKSFLVTEAERKHVRRRARFQQHRDASCQFFFHARQGAEGNSRHSDRNIRGTCTIVCQPSKTGCPVLTWWFFHLWCASSWTTQNSDHPGDYWSNSRANLGRQPGRISAKSIAEQLGISREPSFMKICTYGSPPRSGSRNAWTRIINVNGASRLSNVWNFFISARSKWSVAIGDHGRNLVISLWPGDKATINGVAA